MDNQFLTIVAYVISIIGAAITFLAKYMVKTPKTEGASKEIEEPSDSETENNAFEPRTEGYVSKQLITIKLAGLWILIVGVVILFFVNR